MVQYHTRPGLPHRFLADIAIADVAFEAEAPSLEELFSEAGLALSELMVNTELVREKDKVRIEVKAETLDLLLYSFLSKLIYIKDVDGLVFRTYLPVVSEEESGFGLVCECRGERIDPGRHETRMDPKAVTFHMFELSKSDGGWYCRVVIDV